MATWFPYQWDSKDVEVGSFLKYIFRDSDKIVIIKPFLPPPVWGLKVPDHLELIIVILS